MASDSYYVYDNGLGQTISYSTVDEYIKGRLKFTNNFGISFAKVTIEDNEEELSSPELDKFLEEFKIKK